MYKLKKVDGIHDEVVSDKIFHTLAGNVFHLYEYVGEDPEGPAEDPQNKAIQDGNAADVNVNLNASVDNRPVPKSNFVNHVVTLEDLENNPELKDNEVNVGDVITITVQEEESGDFGEYLKKD